MSESPPPPKRQKRSTPAKSLCFATTTTPFDRLPNTTILAHATNCYGIWGYGFAASLAKSYPAAYKVYSKHCNATRSRKSAPPSRDLVGTCLLIPPQDGDLTNAGELSKDDGQVWIACLFTSYGYGKSRGRAKGREHEAKDSVEEVLANTAKALRELRRQVEEIVPLAGRGGGRKQDGQDGEEGGDDRDAGDDTEGQAEMQAVINSPRFNAGAFGVDWEDTKGRIEEVFKGWEGKWVVLER